MVFALIEGIIVSYDSPAFQALTVRLVPRGEFQQAIALNSTNFHASRMLGPLVAAWLMSYYGPSLVFLFDGITYFLVAFVLSRITTNAPPLKGSTGSKGLWEGLRYIWNSVYLKYYVAQLMITIGCAFPMMAAVFRVFVQKKFDLEAAEFGHVFSVAALGSMTGALSFAAIKPAKPIRALWVGIPSCFRC
jgi:MFS family permease